MLHESRLQMQRECGVGLSESHSLVREKRCKHWHGFVKEMISVAQLGAGVGNLQHQKSLNNVRGEKKTCVCVCVGGQVTNGRM